MLEARDPAIKLFGKTIPVPEISSGSGDSTGAPDSSSGDVVDEGIIQNHASSINSSNTNMDEEEREIDEDTMEEEPAEYKKEKDEALTQLSEKNADINTASRLVEESINLSAEEEQKSKEEQGESSQDKTLKKPDKILPCPRCNSMDTKFCYYNNYNVNQPRHFCKNCQRYWTAGGAMRNVPVGAGRRKNKNPGSQYRQITVPEVAVQNSQSKLANAVHHPSLNCNGTVFTFGTDSPLCESMESALNLADKGISISPKNGFIRPEELRIHVPFTGEEMRNDDSNKSSDGSTTPTEKVTSSNSLEQVMPNCQSFPPQVPYYPGAPWLFPWNPAQWSSQVQPPPAFFPQGFAVPLYPPPAYWGFTVPGAWNNPWLAQQSSPNSASLNSGPNSPTLGKHSREESTVKSNDAAGGSDEGIDKEEKSLWVPKTLRIDDLGEAEKSSILTTLGIKNNKTDLIRGGGGLFKAFASKGDEKDGMQNSNSPVLQANPAALSRSISFRETS
ncbi:unnamed protein product [Lathyrus oleraceus]|uniref:Dof-type domain-containing protein n=1 Tax=Pisum sativum TaxID=3888 RepID=A0A9D5BG60_PEA|nr:cyclic dof factor 2-like [Pisum sativum]KAI5442971.1 hypothetical protein KIW84_011852 [Pisum sativum]